MEPIPRRMLPREKMKSSEYCGDLEDGASEGLVRSYLGRRYNAE